MSEQIMLEYGTFVVIRDNLKSARTVLDCLGSIEQIMEVRKLDQLPLRVRTLKQGFTYSYGEDQIVPLTLEQVAAITKEHEVNAKHALKMLKQIVKDFKDDVLIPAEKQGIYLSDGKLYTVDNIPFEKSTFTEEERELLKKTYEESPEKAVKLLEELDKKANEEVNPTASECIVVVAATPKADPAQCGVKFNWGDDESFEPKKADIDFEKLAREARERREREAAAEPTEKHLGFTVEEQSKSYQPQIAQRTQSTVVAEQPPIAPADDNFVEPYLRDVGETGYKIMLYSRFGNQSPSVTKCNFLVVQPDKKIVTNSHINISKYPPYKDYISVVNEDSYPIAVKIAIRKAVSDLYYQNVGLVRVGNGDEAKFLAQSLIKEAAVR